VKMPDNLQVINDSVFYGYYRKWYFYNL
jgi:hypothetical protein